MVVLSLNGNIFKEREGERVLFTVVRKWKIGENTYMKFISLINRNFRGPAKPRADGCCSTRIHGSYTM